MRFLIINLFFVFVFGGCATTKYIPKEYFLKRHDMAIQVKPLPAPSHIETGGDDQGIVGSLISAAAHSSRARDMEAVFSHIDAEVLRADLRSSLSEKIKEFYDVNDEKRDLKVDIQITSWGWILPTGSFGIRAGSYQIQFSGFVRVFDLKDQGKEIAHIELNTQEQMRDQMSKEETSRKVRHAIDEFAELTAEFLWRSDKK